MIEAFLIEDMILVGGKKNPIPVKHIIHTETNIQNYTHHTNKYIHFRNTHKNITRLHL